MPSCSPPSFPSVSLSLQLTWHRFGVLVPVLEAVDGVVVVGTSGVAPYAGAVRIAVRRSHPRTDVSVVNRHVGLKTENSYTV